MIVKLGGCNGSGKTTLMRGLMDLWEFKPLTTKGTKTTAYSAAVKPTDLMAHLFKQVIVLGSYATVCGGMDTISDKHERLALVEQYTGPLHADKLVFYEGLITGKTYGAMGALSEASSVPWLYTFMDTPFDVCVKRVLARRAAKGNNAPFDPERTMRPTYKSCLTVARRAAAIGHPVSMVDHKLSTTKAAKSICLEVSKVMGGKNVIGGLRAR